MYQGHKSRSHYVRAWTEHVSDLRWMFLETMDHAAMQQRYDQLLADIEAAADELVKRGKLEDDS